MQMLDGTTELKNDLRREITEYVITDIDMFIKVSTTNIANKMLNNGISKDLIKKITGINLEKVNE